MTHTINRPVLAFTHQKTNNTQTTKVILHLYDLSPANDIILYAIGCGLHHSGIEILGDEYSFSSGAGIFHSTPKDAPGAIFRESLELGLFDGGTKQLQSILSELRQDFGPNDYHLLRKNCNHFANALCWALLGKSIPPYINRLAEIGICCSCLLPRQLVEHAPVGDTTNNNSSSTSTSTGGTTFARSRATSRTVAPLFTGTGSKLGSSSGNNKTTTGNDDLVDRREKARKAALARLERNQQVGGGGNTTN